LGKTVVKKVPATTLALSPKRAREEDSGRKKSGYQIFGLSLSETWKKLKNALDNCI